jgi:ABC-type spermidine/putrescine transport system permease subunit II
MPHVLNILVALVLGGLLALAFRRIRARGRDTRRAPSVSSIVVPSWRRVAAMLHRYRWRRIVLFVAVCLLAIVAITWTVRLLG